jgi:hypothetical protein
MPFRGLDIALRRRGSSGGSDVPWVRAPLSSESTDVALRGEGSAHFSSLTQRYVNFISRVRKQGRCPRVHFDGMI